MRNRFCASFHMAENAKRTLELTQKVKNCNFPRNKTKSAILAKILQIGMIPDNMPLFKFICALYQFHHQTLPIMKIQFRDYVFTGTEPWISFELRNKTP